MTGRSSQRISEQPAFAAAKQHDGVLAAVRRLWRAGEAGAASHAAAAGPEPGPGPQRIGFHDISKVKPAA